MSPQLEIVKTITTK